MEEGLGLGVYRQSWSRSVEGCVQGVVVAVVRTRQLQQEQLLIPENIVDSNTSAFYDSSCVFLF